MKSPVALVFTSILYAIYSAIFPYFVPEHAELRPEPSANSHWHRLSERIATFLERYPKLAGVVAHIRLNYYMPIVHPISWWRHLNAVDQLLEEIGWIDFNVDW